MRLLDIICKIGGHTVVISTGIAGIMYAFQDDATNCLLAIIASMVARIVMVLDGDA